MTGTIFNFQRSCFHDGPGLRSTAFLAGCPLACRWCCNPEGLFPGPHQRRVDAAELVELFRADRGFYEASGGGATLSGGEPLLQAEFAAAVLAGCRRQGIGTALETCGAVPWNAFAQVAGLVDHYLFDIKVFDRLAHEGQTGLPNDLIFDNLNRLAETGVRIILRSPLVAGVNFDADHARRLGELAVRIKAAEVQLMPYHRLGESKYQALGRPFPLAGQTDLYAASGGRAAVEDFRKLVAAHFPQTFIGG